MERKLVMDGKGLSGIVFWGMEQLSRLAVLNLLWLLFSLPVVTLIPATAALFAVMKKLEEQEEDEEKGLFQKFLSSFRDNFKKSYKTGLPLAGIGLILAIDLQLLYFPDTGWLLTLKYMMYTLLLLYVIMAIFTFPVMAYFDLPWYKTLFFALMTGLMRPHYSVAVIGTAAALSAVFLIWPGLFFFFSLSTVAFLATKLAKRYWDKIIPISEKLEKQTEA
ncbi:YesL family protein [Evansella clarkii]|uniref:YesL family protein n=1 Tax=Evansella clarkii TaxID=79879 RepID=UPI000998DDF8|nr:DUF624 domain-containing protein [Evansella clarkii]